MPSMASITIKKADSVTDATYAMLAASPGDGGWAYWRLDVGGPAGLPVSMRPTFKLGTTWNGPKTARVLRTLWAMPYAVQDTTTGLFLAKDRLLIESTATIPQAIPDTVINEVVQGASLYNAALVKLCLQSGYAPT